MKTSPILSDYVRVVLRECHQCGFEQSEFTYKTIVIESRELADLIVNQHYTVIGAEKTEDAPKNTME